MPAAPGPETLARWWCSSPHQAPGQASGEALSTAPSCCASCARSQMDRPPPNATIPAAPAGMRRVSQSPHMHGCSSRMLQSAAVAATHPLPHNFGRPGVHQVRNDLSTLRARTVSASHQAAPSRARAQLQHTWAGAAKLQNPSMPLFPNEPESHQGRRANDSSAATGSRSAGASSQSGHSGTLDAPRSSCMGAAGQR